MLDTISSSNPKMDSIFFSIHWAITVALTFVRSTGIAKDDGNLVDRRSLVCATLEGMDAVPLMDGIGSWKDSYGWLVG
jgi:hypothetical protein